MTSDAREDRLSGAKAREERRLGQMAQSRSSRLEINGWLNLDKPTGVSSTQAVGRLKFLFKARRPATPARSIRSSGVLPVAFGEATRQYRSFRTGPTLPLSRALGRGATDDAEEIVARSTGARPQPKSSLLPRFVGAIRRRRRPSPLSASLARAYDLAARRLNLELNRA
jgi:tRNA pseudouridine55 synthase